MKSVAEVQEWIENLRRKSELDKHVTEHADAQSLWQLFRWASKWLALLLVLPASWFGTPEHVALVGVIAGVLFLLDKALHNPWATVHGRLVKKGRAIRLALIQSNDQWPDPEREEPLPGSAVGTFDPPLAEDEDELARVAEKVGELKDRDRTAMTPGEAALAWNLYHEIPLTPRVPVPEEICGNRRTWLYSVALPPDAFDDGPLDWGIALEDEDHPSGCSVLRAR